MRARLRSVLHDLRRTAAGAAALGRHLLTNDRLDLALGALEVGDAAPGEGAGLRCRVRVANARPREREATLILELGPAETEGSVPGTRVVTVLRVPSLGLTRVELEHGSGTSPRLLVDGHSAPLGQEVSGALARALPTTGLLSIRARLLEEGRELHPPLVVYQALGR